MLVKAFTNRKPRVIYTTFMRVRDAAVDDLVAILEIYNHCVLHSTCTADIEPHTGCR
jgi:hypothetical protein